MSQHRGETPNVARWVTSDSRTGRGLPANLQTLAVSTTVFRVRNRRRMPSRCDTTRREGHGCLARQVDGRR